MTGHKHAKIIMEYAIEAQTNSEPWREFEFQARNTSGDWEDLNASPGFFENNHYRRKPKTIRIGEFDVPEPLRVAPKVGEVFWSAKADGKTGRYHWGNQPHSSCHSWLAAGLCHDNEEAANLHSRALRSFTEVKGENDE